MNSKHNLLIIEDEVVASHYLIKILESLGYVSLFESFNLSDALSLVKKANIDIIFMDINLSGALDGIEYAQIINKERPIPIIYTTAYNDSKTILKASDTNLFGYLIKPFEKEDVKTALDAAEKKIGTLRAKESCVHHTTKTGKILCFHSKQTFNLEKKTFSIDNQPVNLTKKEMDILFVLCNNLNNNVTYSILRESVWEEKEVADSTIRDTVSRLKKKVPDLTIENIKNYGYILKS